MELVSGKAINKYVEEHRTTLGMAGILLLFKQVCDAIHYAHQQGVIHRDLKPGNILVDSDAEPRVIDFGLARCNGGAIEHTEIAYRSGTPGYMSPEQCISAAEPVTSACDVYALGIVLYELLTGHHPYKTRSTPSHKAGETAMPDISFERLSRACPGCSNELISTVAKAISPRHVDRFSTIAELRQAVIRCLNAVQIRQQRSAACRRLLIKKVEEFWIEGVLRNSQRTIGLMNPELKLCPQTVERPWDLIVQAVDQGPFAVAVDTKIVDVFCGSEEALLILGDPGAGKTTLLLELARELLSRAQQDETQRVPVVFHLSTWAEQELPLSAWLIGELEKRYELPLRAASNCIESNHLILLLDGLDEVAPACRDRCVAAINDFRKQYTPTSLVVCSRVADYTGLSLRLRFAGAVMIEPLTRRKIADCLEQAGASVESLRVALNSDDQLWDLLKTPLMLSIAVMVYRHCLGATFQGTGTRTLEERRSQLFTAYIETVFTRRRKMTHFTRDRTMHWLAWLARSMLQRHQSVFYLEWMQPDLLVRPWQRRLVSVGSVVVCGLLVGIVTGLSSGLDDDRASSLPLSLAWGLGGGFAIGLLGYGDKIKPVTRLRWSRTALFDGLSRTLGLAVAGGLILGAGLALMFDEIIGMAIGLATAAAFCYFGGIDLDVKATDVRCLTVSNGAIRRSLRHALGGAIAGSCIGAVVGGFAGGWNGVVLGASVLSLIGALTFGGFPCLQHLFLRCLLWCNGSIPRHYAPFLDYAVDRILLHRVGTGYAFIHRALLEYFADKESTTVENQTGAR